MQARTIVGMEIHVQLRTQTKMFCGCPVRFGAPPNTCVCPVCLGHPGALPVMNRAAVEMAVRTAMALNCTISQHTKWDRKSYYYPDMPKNYQISQYDQPIGLDGWFDMVVDGEPRRVRIRRLHLEEDAGKNLHDVPGCTLVDLNRAGTPLMEIVTEPDLHSADEAYTFATELQRLIVHLGVSEAVMQRGQMRFEPNVNVHIDADGETFRTPIAEIKNLNSFRSVRNAVAYESERHVAEWRSDRGYALGTRKNENRGWNDDRGVTEYQREKEAAHDYRYFPDPDLAPAHFEDSWLGAVRAALPEAPVARRSRLMQSLGLSLKDADTIVDHRPTADLFEAVLAAGAPADVAGKQFINTWLGLANDRGVSVTELPVDMERMAELARITADGTINKTAANQLAQAMLDRPERPAALATELGLIQEQDRGATATWVEHALTANPQAVQDAQANPKKKQAAIGFLRGQVMKLSGGKADPRLVGEILEARLNQP